MRAGVGSTGSANRARRLDWTEPIVLDDDPRGLGQRESSDYYKSFILNDLHPVSWRFPRRFPLSQLESTGPFETFSACSGSQLAHRPPPFSASKLAETAGGCSSTSTVTTRVHLPRPGS